MVILACGSTKKKWRGGNNNNAAWYSGANVDYRDGGGRVRGHHHDVGGGGCGRGVGWGTNI